MNLLFMQNGLPPYGIPRNGLVSIIDPGRQILTGATGQTLVDYSGRGNTFQLGSTASADTNDPAWSGNGLVFGADDYAVNATSLVLSGDRTIIIAFTTPTAFTVGDYFFTNKYQSPSLFDCFVNIDADWIFQDSFSGVASNYKFGNNLPLATNMIMGFISSQNQMKIGRGSSIGTKAVIGVPDAVEMGKYKGIAGGGNVYLVVVYNRALTDAEYMQAYNGLRRLMNARGVVI